MKKVIFLIMIISNMFAQTYCAGDQISISDQNLEHTVGAAMGGYELGDTFKLADYNGDLNGRQIETIFEGFQSSGLHSYRWNATEIPSGVYYVKLQFENQVETMKAVLVK